MSILQKMEWILLKRMVLPETLLMGFEMAAFHFQ